jgi:CRP/FNR family transcriptional regulator, dissimilatory nitrate respiration regulator
MFQLSQELTEFLGQTALLQNLADESLEQVARIGIQQSFQTGDLLFSDNDECKGSFIILEGQVKVFKYAETGREQIMGMLGTGDYLAGVPAFDGRWYSANAMALDPLEVIFLPRHPFLELLRRDPTLSFNLLTIFSHHLRRFAQLIETLSLKEVSGRIATYLLLLSHQSGNSAVVELAITKAQLAAFIGTVPETLSRVLQKMGRDGLLKLDGNTIMILDSQELKALAGYCSPRVMF